MPHFRVSLQHAPVLTIFFERWCCQQQVYAWGQVTVQCVSKISTWLCDEAHFLVSSQLSSGEYGILRGLWANVPHATFGVTSDTSGLKALSPCSKGITCNDPSAITVVCLRFDTAHGVEPSSLILRDHILHLDKNPSPRLYFWFPAHLEPRRA